MGVFEETKTILCFDTNKNGPHYRHFPIIKVRPHRTRSAAADCGLCPLRSVTS